MPEEEYKRSSRRRTSRDEDTRSSGSSSSSSSTKNMNGTGNGSNTNTGKGKGDKIRKKKKAVLVDFNKLEMGSLLRYKKHYQLPVRATCPKSELIILVKKHFHQQARLREAETISNFLFANKKAKELYGQTD